VTTAELIDCKIGDILRTWVEGKFRDCELAEFDPVSLMARVRRVGKTQDGHRYPKIPRRAYELERTPILPFVQDGTTNVVADLLRDQGFTDAADWLQANYKPRIEG